MYFDLAFMGNVLFFALAALFKLDVFDFGSSSSEEDTNTDTSPDTDTDTGTTTTDGTDTSTTDTNSASGVTDYYDAAQYATSASGTDGDDALISANFPAASSYFALGGNDSVAASTGNDFVSGGAGNDVINAGDGNDLLAGDADDDLIFGENGLDTVFGGDGADRLYGGNGNDSLFGEAGNDSLFGGDGADSLNGGDGNDVLNGATDAATWRTDLLFDTVDGGLGDDTIYVGTGDTATGGGGADVFHVWDSESIDDPVTQISDFTAATDVLQIHYTATQSIASPTLTSQFDQTNNFLSIRLDGQEVVRLTGVSTIDLLRDVVLVEET